MKTHLGITIPEPCNEDWQKMTPTDKGRHCHSCEKEVIDFTSFTKAEIHTHLTKGSSICGRFRKDQLDAPLYLRPSTFRDWKKYVASLLFPAALFVTNEGIAQGEPYIHSIEKVTSTEQVTKKYDSLGIGSLSQKQNTPISPCSIKGKITTNDGDLFGAHITIKGTNRYTSTANNGSYNIKISEGETLVFTFLGYTSQEIIYKEQSSINVYLEKDDILTPYDSFIMGGPRAIQDTKNN